MENTVDIITYAGEVNSEGYELLCRELTKKASSQVVLVLATPGGDPHAGFRIARALQHIYNGFEALIPRYCKSAGTLIAVGAKKLYLDDMSELGPLDIQVKKGDELFGRSSGLDIFQAVNFLQAQAMSAFRSYLFELTGPAGLSTKVGSNIASSLACGLLEPIAAQIDPLKLAEMQRATDIAFEYGKRLNDHEHSANLQPDGLAKLVSGYPSHGFVIDRKEARTVFLRVEKPDGLYGEISRQIHPSIASQTSSRSPLVNLATLPLPPQESAHAQDLPNTQTSAAGATESPAEINGACTTDRAGSSSEHTERAEQA